MDLERQIDQTLAGAPYGMPEAERQANLLTLLRRQVARAAEHSAVYRNYVVHWPVALEEAERIADLPYLPVSVFKREPPLTLVPPAEVRRVMLSSATSGQQPSRIAADVITARRMSKGVVAILRDFIGADRRPYLVVDEAATNAPGAALSARGAAIRGLSPFASQTVYCLRAADQELDLEVLRAFADEHRDRSVMVYGFTTLLWTKLVVPLSEQGWCLDLPNVHILHSGGWKKLVEQAVNKETFNQHTAAVFGCEPKRIIDFYGMVENLGIVYPDCSEGNKHAPVTGEVVIRAPLSFEPVGVGEQGIVQVCSVLPNSYPGHLLLTDDVAEVVCADGCGCGRPGIGFRFVGRVARAEVRGCGNIEPR